MESTTPYLLRFGHEGVHDIDMRGKTDTQIWAALEEYKPSTERELYSHLSEKTTEYIKQRHEDLICEVDRVFTDASSREFTKSLFAAIKRDPKRIGIIMKCMGPGADKVWEIFVYMLTHGEADFGRHSVGFSNGMKIEDCTHKQSLVLWLDLLFLVIGERFSAALDELEEKRGIRWAQYRHHPWSFQHFHEINGSETQRAIPANPVREDVPNPTEGDDMSQIIPTQGDVQELLNRIPGKLLPTLQKCLATVTRTAAPYHLVKGELDEVARMEAPLLCKIGVLRGEAQLSFATPFTQLVVAYQHNMLTPEMFEPKTAPTDPIRDAKFFQAPAEDVCDPEHQGYSAELARLYFENHAPQGHRANLALILQVTDNKPPHVIEVGRLPELGFPTPSEEFTTWISDDCLVLKPEFAALIPFARAGFLDYPAEIEPAPFRQIPAAPIVLPATKPHDAALVIGTPSESVDDHPGMVACITDDGSEQTFWLSEENFQKAWSLCSKPELYADGSVAIQVNLSDLDPQNNRVMGEALLHSPASRIVAQGVIHATFATVTKFFSAHPR